MQKERHEYSTKTDSDYGYGSTTRFRPIDKDVSGARAIRVQDIPNGAVGRPVEFESMHSIASIVNEMRFYNATNFSNILFCSPKTVDGSQAGSGNLEILVNGGRVTSSVRALGAQRFVASFTPHEPGVHTVQITFNGSTVPGTNQLQFSIQLFQNSSNEEKAS